MQEPRKAERQLMRWAIVLLLLGLSPLIANLLAVWIAPLFGCLVIEHGAYTKLDLPDEVYGDLRPGCSVNGVEVGPVLHFMLMSGLAIVFTWPAVLGSLMIWLTLLLRFLRRRRDRGRASPLADD